MPEGVLPRAIGIGAMKAGTTALHHYLASHPDMHMPEFKELNFFFGERPTDEASPWSAAGNWWRGPAWYRSHFPADGRVGGEVSPGYTSPDHPTVASRMAATVPEARLVYLVRDPWARAVSQYRHHRRDGAESRPAHVALLDPDSQYVARSRYHDRLRPFLQHFRTEQVLVVLQEDLDRHRRPTLERIHRHIGVRPHWSAGLGRRWHTADEPPPQVRASTQRMFRALVDDDVARLAALTDGLPWPRA